jgi:hypothetical protein
LIRTLTNLLQKFLFEQFKRDFHPLLLAHVDRMLAYNISFQSDPVKIHWVEDPRVTLKKLKDSTLPADIRAIELFGRSDSDRAGGHPTVRGRRVQLGKSQGSAETVIDSKQRSAQSIRKMQASYPRSVRR